MASVRLKNGLSVTGLFVALSGLLFFLFQGYSKSTDLSRQHELRIHRSAGNHLEGLCTFDENGCIAVKLANCTSGSCDGTGIVYVPCTSENCPAIWSEWMVLKTKNNESICTQTRQRNCTNIDNVPNCQKYQTESIICKTSLWSPWNDWKCSQSDTGCTARRKRICYIGVDNTPCNGSSYEDGECTTSRCLGQPVSFWNEWSDNKCFFENNGCFHIRNRTCSTGLNDDCEGKYYHISAVCSTSCYGKWSDWSGWHCKRGGAAYTAHRSRNCSAQAPVTCQGSANELYSCGPTPCPVCNEFTASTVIPGPDGASNWTSWRCFKSNNIVYRIRYDSRCSGSECQDKQNHEIDWCNVAKCPDCYNESAPVAIPTELPHSNQVTADVSTDNPWDHWRCVNDTDTGLMFRVEHKDCDTIDCKSEIHAMQPCNLTQCPECFPHTDPDNILCYDAFGTTCSSLGLQQNRCNDPDFSSICRKTCRLCEISLAQNNVTTTSTTTLRTLNLSTSGVNLLSTSSIDLPTSGFTLSSASGVELSTTSGSNLPTTYGVNVSTTSDDNLSTTSSVNLSSTSDVSPPRTSVVSLPTTPVVNSATISGDYSSTTSFSTNNKTIIPQATTPFGLSTTTSTFTTSEELTTVYSTASSISFNSTINTASTELPIITSTQFNTSSPITIKSTSASNLSVSTITSGISTDSPDSLKNVTNIPSIITVPGSSLTSTKNTSNHTTISSSYAPKTTKTLVTNNFESFATDTIETTTSITRGQNQTSGFASFATTPMSQQNTSESTGYTTDNCYDDPDTACGAFNRFLCDDPKLSFELCRKTCNMCDSTSTTSISTTIRDGKPTSQVTSIAASTSPGYLSTNTSIDSSISTNLTTQSFKNTTVSVINTPSTTSTAVPTDTATSLSMSSITGYPEANATTVTSRTSAISVTDSVSSVSSTSVDSTGIDLCIDEYGSTCTSLGLTQGICEDPSIAIFCRKSCNLCDNTSSMPFSTGVTLTENISNGSTVSTTNSGNFQNSDGKTTIHITSINTSTINSLVHSSSTASNFSSSTTTTNRAITVTSNPSSSNITSSSNTIATLPVISASGVSTPQTDKTTIKATPAPTITTKLTNPDTTNTAQIGHTKAPTTIKCAVCFGPPELCDELFEIQTCNAPNNFCINHVKNFDDGSRIVERGCGNHTRCYREWFQGSSDSDKCQRFVEDNVITLEFECTYCCIKDECNVKMHPARDTLYNDI